MLWMFYLSCGASIDPLLFSGVVHCEDLETNYDAVCVDQSYWDRVCTGCDEEYPWGRDYEWMPNTLDETVTSVRPITVYEQHKLTTSDGEGELDLYYIPSHGENPKVANTLMVYSHGRFGNVEHYLHRTRFLHEAGYAQLIWDYRGYGKSQPNSVASAEVFVRDAREVLAFSPTVAPDPGRIIIYGQSLGAIAAVEMAIAAQNGDIDVQPCAMFLESGVTSTRQGVESITSLSVPGSFVSQGYFEVDQHIAKYEGPLFMMHGTADLYFIIEHVRENYESAPGPKALWEAEGVEHGIEPNGGIPEDGLGEYFAQMENFLDTIAPACIAQSE
ncbi:MAG: alpha/beta fold hydrolase [Myxococcota bacterium]|nr:alpha/beta fold hydrolase [Myxococcota bacterium]